jgi:uncharacterized protein
MRQLIICILFFLFTSNLALAEIELKGSPRELSKYLSPLPEKVSIRGEAKIEIQTESGIVTLGIKTESSQLQKSLKKNQTFRSEITTQLTKSGINESRIKGTKFSSTPEYGFFGKKPNNYVVKANLKITIQNEKELQEVARIVDSNENVFYHGLELKEQEKNEIKKKLLDMALKNASAKKIIFETELGITLKPIKFYDYISIKEEIARQPHSIQNEIVLHEKISSEESNSSYEGGLSFGDHTYRGSVEILYSVTPNESK